ncbi:ELWxxDGT repeat protein [Deferribacteres bacterium DY0037]
MKRIVIYLLICTLTLLSGGCNFFGDSGGSSISVPGDGGGDDPSGDGGDTSPTASAYGYFVDNFVVGLSYECSPSGVKGTTDSEGRYGYKDGDTVTFKVGEIELGSCAVSEYVTPMTLFPEDDDLALNVAQLLQSIDSDGDPTNGITPDPDALEALKNINIKGSDFESNLQANLPSKLTLVGREQAMNHVEETFNHYAINPNGSYHSIPRLFVGGDEEHGFEIWKTENGKTFELLKDLDNGGTYGSKPEAFAKIGSKIFVSAATGQYGYELWVTDGTPAGTKIVKDIYPGVLSSYPQQLTVVDDVLYFVARTEETGDELWKSDGTEAGTVMVKDIETGEDSSDPSDLMTYNSKLYFTAYTTTEGREVWTSDGTEAGTKLLKDLNPGTSSSSPNNMSVADGLLWFKIYDGTNYHLVKSDGTTAGTTSVDDTINAYSNLVVFNDKIYYFSYDHLKTADSSAVTDLIAFVNGKRLYSGETKIYFTMYGTNSLYVTNGTGTIAAVTDDNNDTINASDGVVVNDQFIFPHDRASDNIGTELWKADGDAATLVKDIYTGASSSDINYLTAMGTKAVFAATTEANGEELWITDGTSAGTEILKDIAADGDSDPSTFTLIDGNIYFRASDVSDNLEMWVTDGTTEGTKLHADINKTPISGIYPNASIFNIGDNYVFNSTDNILWLSDGTAAGTVATEYDARYLGKAVPFGDNLVYPSRYDNEYKLIKTDGTNEGTQVIETFSYISNSYFSVSGDKLFFAGNPTETDTTSVYVTDGMQASANILLDSNNDPITDVRSLVTASDGKVAIANKSYNSGTDDYTAKLYFSDGTPEGTYVVKESTSDNAYISNLTYVNGEVFFITVDAESGYELWSSDGTVAGTILVKDITDELENTESSGIGSLLNVNGTLYFIAYDNDNFGDLWKSDGTPEGTVLIKNTESTRAKKDLGVLPLAVVDDKFYFITTDDFDNQEAWVIHTRSNLMQKVDLGDISLNDYALSGSYKVVDGIYRDTEYILIWFANEETKHVIQKKIIGSASKTIADFYYYPTSKN